MERSRGRVRWLALAMAVLGVATLVRLWRLDATAIWVDEMSRVLWAKGREPAAVWGAGAADTAIRQPPRSLASAVRVTLAHNPPLNGAVLNVWMRATGSDSDWTLRLPSAIFGVLTVAAMLLAGTALAGPAAGLWTAVLVAVSPFHVYYSQEVNHYTLATSWLALSFVFYFHLLRRPTSMASLGLAVSGVAAVYTHYHCGVVLLAQALGALAFHGRNWRALPPFALAYGLVGLALVPYLPTFVRQLPELTAVSIMGPFGGLGMLSSGMRMMTLWPWLGDAHTRAPTWLCIAAPTAAAWLVVAGLRALPSRWRAAMVTVIGVPPVTAVLLFLASGKNSFLWPRYQIFLTLAVLLAMGVGLAARAGRASALADGAAVVVLVVAGSFAFWHYHTTFSRGDWGRAAAAIGRSPTDEPVLVFPWNLTDAMARYVTTPHPLYSIRPQLPLPEAALEAAVAGRSGVWLALTWSEGQPAAAALQRFLDQRFERAEPATVSPGLDQLTLVQYRRAQAPDARASP